MMPSLFGGIGFRRRQGRSYRPSLWTEFIASDRVVVFATNEAMRRVWLFAQSARALLYPIDFQVMGTGWPL